MLIITVESNAARLNFRLDGPLAGAAVGELARSWLAKAFDRPQQRVSLDLSGVTSIDVEGKAFLAQAYRHGNRLLGGVATKAIVDELQATSAADSRSAMLGVEGTLRSPVDGVLRSRVEALLHGSVRHVLLDLSRVIDIDAAGVGELMRIFHIAAAAGGAVEIARASGHVHRVLEVAGVFNLLTGTHSRPKVDRLSEAKRAES